MCLVCLFFDPEKALVIRRTEKVGIIKATPLFILDKKLNVFLTLVDVLGMIE